MELLFLFVCIIEMIIQIKLLIKLKKECISKEWYSFLGTNIAIFISNIVAYSLFANKANGLSDAIGCLLTCGFVLVSNIILFIIGLIIKRIIKNKFKKSNKASFIKSSIIILICNLIILFVIPGFISKNNLNTGEKFIIKYLEKKYGNSNYEVVNIYEEYCNSGMWDKYLCGYYYEVKSDYMENTFIISVDDNFAYIDEDFFIPVYYSQKYNLKYILEYDDWYTSIEYDFDEFNNYITTSIEDKYLVETKNLEIEDLYIDYVKSWNNIDGAEYNSNYFIVSNNYGKIPSFDELIGLLINYYN